LVSQRLGLFVVSQRQPELAAVVTNLVTVLGAAFAGGISTRVCLDTPVRQSI
jgi:hypothetical protein